MSNTYPFLILKQPCNDAIEWFIHRVGEVGLQVLRTFDLQAARNNTMEYSCPQHGANQCNCQMVVLLVYSGNDQPLSLVAHSQAGSTWFSLVDTAQQRANPRLERVIRQALPLEL